MEIEERERLLREAVLGLAPDVGRDLLHVIDHGVRGAAAEAVGRLWAPRPGDSIAEFLIDLEEDRGIALDVAMALTDSLPVSER